MTVTYALNPLTMPTVGRPFVIQFVRLNQRTKNLTCLVTATKKKVSREDKSVLNFFLNDRTNPIHRNHYD